MPASKQKTADADILFFEFSRHEPRHEPTPPMYGKATHLAEAESYAHRINQNRATSLFAVRQLSPIDVRRLKLDQRADVFDVADEFAKLQGLRP